MDVGAAEFFSRDFLAGRRFHERRAAEKDRALISDDDGFVAHRGNVSAAGRARTHHCRNLIDPGARHPRLVVEDAAEVIAVRKDFRLQRKKRAAGIDEVQARQTILHRDFLRAQMLLHRDRKVGAALDGRVVGDDDRLVTLNHSDSGDQSGAMALRRRTCRLRRGR